MQEFLARHPLFTHAEFVEAHTSRGRSRRTSDALLAGYVRRGLLQRVRRGLYSVVPAGAAPDTFAPDPYLVASKLTDDATVAYHAALQFHGRSYSLWHRLHFLTGTHTQRIDHAGVEYVPVLAPVAVRELPQLGGGVEVRRHAGGEVRVTTLERTLVDVLHSPDKCGSWEELWRSLEMVEYFDLAAVTHYALELGSALAVGRLGFFLEQNRERLMVEDAHLEVLMPFAPAQPRYLDTRRESGRLVMPWNLVVPDGVLNRSWNEVG